MNIVKERNHYAGLFRDYIFILIETNSSINEEIQYLEQRCMFSDFATIVYDKDRLVWNNKFTFVSLQKKYKHKIVLASIYDFHVTPWE